MGSVDKLRGFCSFCGASCWPHLPPDHAAQGDYDTREKGKSFLTLPSVFPASVSDGHKPTVATHCHLRVLQFQDGRLRIPWAKPQAAIYMDIPVPGELCQVGTGASQSVSI